MSSKRVILIRTKPLFLFSAAIVIYLLSPMVSANPMPDGLYLIETQAQYDPVIIVEDGEIKRGYGTLSNYGCNTRQFGAVLHTTPLTSRATLLTQYHFLMLQQNPFTLGRIELHAKNATHEANLKHTVTSHILNPSGQSTTLCYLSHKYSLTRLN